MTSRAQQADALDTLISHAQHDVRCATQDFSSAQATLRSRAAACTCGLQAAVEVAAALVQDLERPEWAPPAPRG